MQLGYREDFMFGKEFNVFLRDKGGEGIHGGFQIQQATALRFLHPFVGVVVAVEDDALMFRDSAADQLLQSGREIRRLLQFVGKLGKLLGHNGIEYDIGTGYGELRAQHAELELVAGEGKGGGAVAVGVVLGEARKDMDPHLHVLLILMAVVIALFDGGKDSGQLIAEEHGNDGGRRLVGAQPVIVARAGNGDTQQILVFVHRLDDGGEEEEKLGVLLRGIAGFQQVDAGIGGDGPVVVLTAAVDPVEGLFVEQAGQAVAVRHLFHHFHRQLVVIRGQVGIGKDRSQLVLGGGHFIVLGFGENPQLPELLVQLLHESCHAGLDDAEIMILQLLALRRFIAEQGTAAQQQILPLLVEFLVHQEIFLFRPHRGGDAGGIGVAE